MKINCKCGNVILISGDSLGCAAHFIPDQEWFATLDNLAAAAMKFATEYQATNLDFEDIYVRVVQSFDARIREIYQCPHCSRIWISDSARELHSFSPDIADGSRQILQAKKERTSQPMSLDVPTHLEE